MVSKCHSARAYRWYMLCLAAACRIRILTYRQSDHKILVPLGVDIAANMLYTIRANPKEYAPKVVPPDPREL